jgi:uncharacterized protein with LGFP repeats
MSMVDHVIWEAAGRGPLNPEGAIYKLWRGYRDEGQYLGVPLSPEVQVGDPTDEEVQQPFSSGAVIAWNPRDGARLVSANVAALATCVVDAARCPASPEARGFAFNRDSPPCARSPRGCSCASMAWVMNALGVPRLAAVASGRNGLPWTAAPHRPARAR